MERLGRKPTILHGQANQGRTIIEKIGRYSGMGYAVVLLAGDDRGALNGAELAGYQPRARQNVVLEAGFLPRDPRAALRLRPARAEVEIQPDYNGVVYVALDGA